MGIFVHILSSRIAMALLELRGVSKKYNEEVVINNTSFQLENGQALGLVGDNGAGKSTIVSMIAGIVPVTSGEILYRGSPINKMRKRFQQESGIVPQEIAIYPLLTAYENFAFWGGMYGLRGQELKERISEITNLLGLQTKLKKKVHTYSGGMKRKVNLGIALLHRPKILLMDEPTVGIDKKSKNQILAVLKKYNDQGMSMIYISHDQQQMDFLCGDNIIRI